MKKKNGFTLVELLAVIVILGLIAVIAIPNSMKVSDGVKKNMLCEKINLLLSDAKRFGNEHLGVLRGATNCYIPVTVQVLIDKGVIKKEENGGITNPYDGSSMVDREIRIYYKNKRAYAYYNETDNILKPIVDACNNLEATGHPTSRCTNLNFN